IRAISTYGAMPESAYSGLRENERSYNHSKLVVMLKEYLDSVLKNVPVQSNWLTGYERILNSTLSVPPASFDYMGKTYTPASFAKDIVKFNPNDYVNITSFTHHPYYSPYIIEVPDNFSNGSYYNIPLNEMIQLAKDAVNKGYTVLW